MTAGPARTGVGILGGVGPRGGDRLGRRTLISVGLVVLTAGIGVADYATGFSVAVAPFYLLPIAVAAWRMDATATRLVVVVSVVSAFLCEHHWEDVEFPLAVSLWNGFARAIIFGGVAALITRLRATREEVTNARTRLQAALAREMVSARTDALTGLANRRGFMEALDRLVQGHEGGVSVAYLDLDDFKAVNDRYGHHAGDDLLREVATHLRQVVRDGDLCARLGGDEFAVLFTRTPPRLVHGAMERLQNAVVSAASRFAHARAGVSIGVVHFRTLPASLEALLGQADAAMYRAKTAGKGRIVSEWAVAEFQTVDA